MKKIDEFATSIEETMPQAPAPAGRSQEQGDGRKQKGAGTTSEVDPARNRPHILSKSERRRARRRAWIMRPLPMGSFTLRVIALLSNPYFLICSLLLGIYIGLFSQTITNLLAPVADLYVELLKMVLIPFMISAIIVSLSRLFGSEMMQRHVGSILKVFSSAIVAVAVLGVACGLALAPGGGFSTVSRQALGRLINRSPYALDLEVALNDPAGNMEPSHTLSLFDRLIPDNIFHALTIGDNLKILFFAIAFGIGLGSLRLNRGDGLRAALLSVYDVCTQIIAWVNMLLPVALCAMVAKQVASVGTAQLATMVKFTVGFGLASGLVFACSVLVLAWASRTGVLGALRAIRDPLMLAIATRSSITCIPSSITALTDGLGYNRAHIESLLPLGITLFRFGPILYYAFATIFAAQLYGIDVSTAGYVLIALGAVLTGLASAGTTGVLTISLLGIIFQPLGLPLEAALALLVTIDPIIDILRTAIIVVPNCAAVALIYRGPWPGGRAEAAVTPD